MSKHQEIVQRPTQSLLKHQNDVTYIVVVSLLSNVDRSHTQWNASSIDLEQTFVSRVHVQLIFENVRRNRKLYTKCKSEKIPETDSSPYNRF